MATTMRTPAPSVPKEMVNSGAMETVCGKGQVRNPLKIENNMFKKNISNIEIFSGLKSFLVKPRYRNKYKTCTPGNEWTKDDKFKINEHYKNECKARGNCK